MSQTPLIWMHRTRADLRQGENRDSRSGGLAQVCEPERSAFAKRADNVPVHEDLDLAGGRDPLLRLSRQPRLLANLKQLGPMTDTPTLVGALVYLTGVTEAARHRMKEGQVLDLRPTV